MLEIWRVIFIDLSMEVFLECWKKNECLNGDSIEVRYLYIWIFIYLFGWVICYRKNIVGVRVKKVFINVFESKIYGNLLFEYNGWY